MYMNSRESGCYGHMGMMCPENLSQKCQIGAQNNDSGSFKTVWNWISGGCSMECPVYLECCRSYWVSQLRKRFRKLWQEILDCKPPKEAFNDWFLEGLANRISPSGPILDPVNASHVPGENTALMKHALLRKPVELKYPKSAKEALENLRIYLDACEVSLGVELIQERRKRVSEALSEGWPAVLEAVRDVYHPLLTRALGKLVEHLGQRLDSAVHEFIDDEEVKVLLSKACEQKIHVYMQNQVNDMCRFSVDKDGLCTTLRNQNVVYDIKLTRVEMLKAQFELSKSRRTEASVNREFHEVVWCMLHRYQSLFGPGGIGSGWHLATPVEVMEVLKDTFHVQHECFASPLNFFFPTYCSVFPDTDVCFGSSGTFSDMSFEDGGSFQAGPPYNLNIMQKMVSRFHEALDTISKPLSFVCVVPDWEGSKPIEDLKCSKYNRASLSLAKEEHYYLCGFQHFCKPKHLRTRFECATYVCWMQNESGFQLWKPSEDRVCQIKRAFMSV